MKKIKQNVTYKYMVTIFIHLLLGCAIQSGLINVFMDYSKSCFGIYIKKNKVV